MLRDIRERVRRNLIAKGVQIEDADRINTGGSLFSRLLRNQKPARPNLVPASIRGGVGALPSAPTVRASLPPKISYGDRFGYDANLDKFENLRNMDVFKSKSFKPVIGQTARRDDVRGLNLSIGDINPITGTTFTGFPKPPPPPVTTTALPNTRTITLPGGRTVQIPEINLPNINSELRIGTMGGPGYGEFPLGTAGPRIDPSDPRYVPPPPGGNRIVSPTPTGMPVAQSTGFTDVGPVDVAPPPAPPVVSAPAPAPTVVSNPAPAPAPAPAPTPYTGGGGRAPFAASVQRVETGMDPITKQLLFGLDGKGGFIPGAMRAAERTFFNPDGTPRVVEEQVAGLTPDQIRALELTRSGVGIQDRFLGDAESAYREGVGALGTGAERAREYGLAGLGATRSGLGSLLSGIGESEGLIRGTLGAYDPSLTGQFYNPFEEQVVQQTISDIMEQGDKQDMLARAQDIGRGGESAFGSRARLGAAERREALGRGLAEAVSGIRSGGFSEAQRLGLGEFARQQQARRTAASSLSGLAGSRMAGQQQLASALGGLGGLEQQIGQQRQQAQFGLAGNLAGLGTQAQAARAADVSQLAGFGLQQQQLEQQRLDAQRRNQLQAQQAPLMQYQALRPFVGMAPAGQFQTSTQFTPAPSPLQAGLATGLGAFGAFGNFINQGQRAV